MRVYLAICFIALPPVVILSQTQRSFDDTKAIEGKENVWELGDECEGDIICPEGRRNARIGRKWPNNTVPYEFDKFYDRKQRHWIMYSLTEITDNSCIKIRLRTKDDKDYVFITEEKPSCSSYTGRIYGRQVLNLKRNKPGHGCFQFAVIVHEFMHVLGFAHQQSVPNRDEYVKVNYENVKEGKEKDFKVYSPDNLRTLGEDYDFNSIMHYSSYAKSKNGKMTIEAKNSSIVIAKNTRLSEIDIRKLNKLYPCPN